MFSSSILDDFKTISLGNASSVSLMDRIDKKFVFKQHRLVGLITLLSRYYDVLDVGGARVQQYKSLYFDTEDRFFFLQHHNDRVNRNKVRFREYVGAGLVFLEVKSKNNKGKTLKNRLKVDKINTVLSEDQKKYIYGVIGQKIDLCSQQWINFNRITFVDKLRTERLTIDLDLTFSDEFSSGKFSDVIIAEIKTSRLSNGSKFTSIAKECGIYPFRVSKYCMSTIHLNPAFKHNRFKQKMIMLNKLK